MGRGRGKGKKQTIISTHEDSGEEEKMPVKRRGRPQKTLKDEVEEIEEHEENGENTKDSISSKENKNEITKENGRKRKRPSLAKENQDLVKKENGVATNGQVDDSVKSVGFRQNRSRRKNKPRRAAEVGVECK
ncbi:hypothetical protein LguiA_014478 [Lonicera macranthoides]